MIYDPRRDPREPDAGSRPVPDPTELTDKAIAKLKEQVEAAAAAELRTVNERVAGLQRADFAIRELREYQVRSLDRFLMAAVDHEREISNIRFQAAERLVGRESELNALALSAAFAAQKEAASVQGTTFGDALGSLGRIVETSLAGLGDKVDDLKERTGRIESQKVGATESRTGLYATVGVAATMFFVLLGVVGFLATRVP